MTFILNIPPSQIAKEAKKDDESSIKKSREEYKKEKELEEARKAGTVPALKDEEGKDINPHIPQYIMQAPWYYGSRQPTLKHQKFFSDSSTSNSNRKFSEIFQRGQSHSSIATKYRKGACENCGAITHQKKDCLERPRKVGAKFTGSNFAPDEYNQPKVKLDYEGKRDKWGAFNTDNYNEMMSETYKQQEEAKKILKTQKVLEGVEKDSNIPYDNEPPGVVGIEKIVSEDNTDTIEDEEKYADDIDMPGTKFESKERMTVRNLRIREDTAKYLHNLDVNSAYYDPKTRSMRENPLERKDKSKQPSLSTYSGDNFVRYSGDTVSLEKQQLFAWEMYNKGVDINLQADPTRLEVLTRQYQSKQKSQKEAAKTSIIDKYGGQKYLHAPPRELMLAQSEEYVEYSRVGKIIRGQEKSHVKSRYTEDVYINNHSSVWGSYWKDGKWGYTCCHSFLKESYCTGEKGKLISETPEQQIEYSKNASELSNNREENEKKNNLETDPTSSSNENDKTDSDEEKRKREKRRSKKRLKKKQRKLKRRKRKYNKRSDIDSDDSSSEHSSDETKHKEEIEETVVHVSDSKRMLDERKLPYNSMKEIREPTEAEMEAYRVKRQRAEDPMTTFLR